jgi:hypothetical protein
MLGGSTRLASPLAASADPWQFGSLISFGFGRHAIVTGKRPRVSCIRARKTGREPCIHRQIESLHEIPETQPPEPQGSGLTIQSIEGFDSGSE